MVISPVGGTAPYTITPAQTALTAGLKTFTVKDAKNCETTVQVTITEPTLALTATKEVGTISCKGGTTSVTITAAGGTAPYTNDGVHTVSAGPYSFEITDAKGCKVTVSGTITDGDGTPPVIRELPSNSTINCPVTPLFAQATAYDNSETEVILTFEDIKTNGACAGTYFMTRTWTAKDACGNTSTASQTINVIDTTAPVIAVPPTRLSINCPETPVFAEATATDECGSLFTLTSADVTTPGACAGSYSITRTWTAKDACGNTSTANQTIRVKDTTAPVIVTCAPNQTIATNSSCEAIVPDFTKNVTASDACTSTDLLIITQSPVAGTVVQSGTTTMLITVKDACGNESTCESKLIVTNFIVANDDAGTPVNGYTGGVSFTNVLSNDLLNCKTVSTENVNISFVSSTNPAVTLSGTNVIVAPGTPVGSYSLVYQICEKLNPANCDTATVTVNVTATVIDAVADTIAGGNGTTGNTNAGNVLSSNPTNPDTLNGTAVTIAQVNLTIVTAPTSIGGAPIPSINTTTGQVSVPAGTPAGTYTIVYQICEKLNPANCDTATVTVNVTAPLIDAVADNITGGNGTLGNANAGNVLSANPTNPDTLNGTAVTIDQVNLTIVTAPTSIGGAPVPSINTTNGQVSVPAGTPAGTYTIAYQICEKLNPANCDSATVTVNVTAPVIDAIADNIAGGNGTLGNANAGNVLSANPTNPDTLNGTAVTIDQVNLTIVTAPTSIGGAPVPSINTTNGQVSVPAGTPAGTYTIAYQICEKLNPANCDSATVTVNVTAPVIDAIADNIAGGNGTLGNANAGNVLSANPTNTDTLNGSAVTIAQVNLTIVTASTSIGGAPVPSINTTTGQVSVPAGTPAGTYTIAYQICEKLNPANCDGATVTVNVTAPLIDAVADNIAGGNGTLGNDNAGNVLSANPTNPDTLNGTAVTIDQVNLTIVTAPTSIGGAPVPSINTTTGQVSVPAGTPAGTYTIVYQICEKLNPANCDTATVTVNVTAPLIDAVADNITGGNGTLGNANAGNVLSANPTNPDTLNGTAVTIDQVNLTIVTAPTSIGGAPVPSINTTTGQVSVPTGTPAGTYTVVYSICDKLNPTNCDSATVTIIVTAPAQIIVAQDDKFIDIDGATGNPNAGNVLNNNENGNDTLNGVNVTIDQINLTVTIPAVSIGGAPVPVIDTTTGQVSIPAGTPAGTYTLVYSICDKLNPTNCDSATVIIEVAVVLGVGCDEIVVHKAFTPNGDGTNEKLVIDGVTDTICYPSGINVEIYNRWGVLVFETTKYNNETNAFDGYSKGRTTISKSDGLPTGTYFYILNYESFDGSGNIQINKKDGFIYLSR